MSAMYLERAVVGCGCDLRCGRTGHCSQQMAHCETLGLQLLARLSCGSHVNVREDDRRRLSALSCFLFRSEDRVEMQVAHR